MSNENVRDPLTILSLTESWLGGDGRAYTAAFRRLGHRVTHLDSQGYVPTQWTRRWMRSARRAMERPCVAEFADRAQAELAAGRYDLLFVYKGQWVDARVIEAARRAGVTSLNVYPDVSVTAHGRYLPAAIRSYDAVFTTKSFQLVDLRAIGCARHLEVIPHAYDPEIHRPVRLTQDDVERYGCDVSFIGTWSPKKQAFLEALLDARPTLRVRIWGSQWERAPKLSKWIMARPVLGWEYPVAISASRINLAILSEARAGSSSGDQITSRTFHIPGSGGFMLHERTRELMDFFEDDQEIGTFDGPQELIAAIDRYLTDDDHRAEVACRGLRRSEESGYSSDRRAETVLDWVYRFRSTSAAIEANSR